MLVVTSVSVEVVTVVDEVVSCVWLVLIMEVVVRRSVFVTSSFGS